MTVDIDKPCGVRLERRLDQAQHLDDRIPPSRGCQEQVRGVPTRDQHPITGLPSDLRLESEPGQSGEVAKKFEAFDVAFIEGADLRRRQAEGADDLPRGLNGQVAATANFNPSCGRRGTVPRIVLRVADMHHFAGADHSAGMSVPSRALRVLDLPFVETFVPHESEVTRSRVEKVHGGVFDIESRFREALNRRAECRGVLHAAQRLRDSPLQGAMMREVEGESAEFHASADGGDWSTEHSNDLTSQIEESGGLFRGR